ncbi:MAG: VCBS repeat-containing protein [Bacteroidales bacterium]|nr:VCBS repeat-containing protein [Bacteroidales bacterium]
MNNLKIMKRVTLILIIIGIMGRLFAQNCDLTPNSIVINNLCSSLQSTLNTGDATLSARDKITLQPGFHITPTNLSGHKFTAKIDHTLANQTNSYESTSVNGTVPALDKSNCIPGTIGGSIDVSPSGAATYQLPIQVSPGSHGMQPNLSIVYSSQGGNGLLGWGWNLGGISTISRVNKSNYYDGVSDIYNLNNTDALVLDGIRLINTSTDPQNPANTYYPANNPYTRVVLTSNYFTVTTQDGMVMEYGKEDNSKGSLYGTPITWAINRVTDPDGNYIRFIYTYNTLTDNNRISEIKYTGNSTSGKEPYNSIKFYYDLREDVNIRYASNSTSKLTQDVLLTGIKVFSEGSLSKTYNFSYFFNQVSKLSQVSLTADGKNFNPTYIRWGATNSYATTVSSLPPNTTTELWGTNSQSELLFGDINGDGRTDIARVDFTNRVIKVGIALESGGYTIQTINLPVDHTTGDSQNYQEYKYQELDTKLADYNNDGKVEIIFHYRYDYKMVLNGVTTKSVWDNVTVYNFTGIDFENSTPYSVSQTVDTPFRTKFYYADINNDGITETLMVKDNSLISCTGVTIPTSISGIDDIQVIDYDNDGQLEVMVLTAFSSNIYKCINSSLTLVPSYNLYPVSGKIYTANFNGDNTTDKIYVYLDNNDTPTWSADFGGAFNNITLPSEITGTDPTSNYQICIADINQDGRDELIFAKNSTIYIYAIDNSCTSFELIHSIETDTLGTSKNYLNVVDLNGDGQLEIVYGTNSSTLPFRYITFNNSLSTGRYVNSITDGMGNTTTITYKNYTDNRLFTTSFPKPAYPLILNRGPFRVVDNVTTVNGANTTANVTYSYAGGYIHCTGQGFLGFKNISWANSVNNISTTSNFSYLIADANNVNYYYTYLSSQNTSKGSTQLSSVTNTMLAKNSSSGKKSFYPITNYSQTVNALEGTTSTTTLDSFDETKGRVTKQTVSNLNGWSFEKSYAFEDVATGKSRLTGITTKRTRPEGGSYTSTETLAYSNSSFPFRLTSQSAMGTTTEFQDFDEYGNPKTIKVGTRTNSTTYDSYGRFVATSTDAAGNTSTYKFRSADGAKLQEVDPNSNQTIYSYTVGSNSLTGTINQPNGTTATTVLNWETQTGILYKITSSITNGNVVTTYYNALGQKVLVNSKGFGGGNINTSYEYYSDGTLKSEETTGHAKVNYTYYNTDGRLHTVSNGTTINLNYLYDGKKTTIQDLIAGVSKEETHDDVGNVTQVKKSTDIVDYYYQPSGKLDSISANGSITRMTYDQTTLNQLTLNDPDAGLTSYAYNSYGQLTSQTDAKLNTIVLEYDETLGGLLKYKKKGTETLEEYQYYTDNGRKGLLKKTIRGNVSETYDYDNLYRNTKVTSEGSGTPLITQYEYGTTGLLTHTEYPTGLKVEYAYDTYGYLTDIYDDANKTTPIWHGTSVNSAQQWTEFHLGNGLITKWSYNTNNMLQTIKTGTSGNETSVQNLGYTFNAQGQLTQRTDNSLSESFSYDDDGNKLNRLTSSTVSGKSPFTTNYFANGNIQSTSLTGAYTYNETQGKPHAVSYVDSLASGMQKSPSINTINTFTYDNKLLTMDNGKYKNEFLYGPSGNRFKVDHYENGIKDYSKIYVGSSEFLFDGSGNATSSRTFIGAPTGICAVWEKVGSASGALHYIHTDNQGSWLKITSSSGAVENTYSYDAWGRPRNPSTWELLPISTSNALGNLNAMQPRFDRGYTGHEHMCGFGLINMNGRLYDPYLQRFLSPDPFVQSPGNAQNYNRYSYCLNNPLMYTDPSGNFQVPIYNWTYQDLSDPGSGGGVPIWYNSGWTIGINSNMGGSIPGSQGYRESDGKYYDNATGKQVDYSTVQTNWVEKKSITYNTSNATSENVQLLIELLLDGNSLRPVQAYGNNWVQYGYKNNWYSLIYGINITNAEVNSVFGDRLNPATIGHNLLGLTYPGGNNPRTYSGKYSYSYVPSNVSEYPAIGHDRRYDNLGTKGLKDLLTDTRAISADFRFVIEELSIASCPYFDPTSRIDAALLGYGLGLMAVPKTLFQLAKPYGLIEIIMWDKVSSAGVTNVPSSDNH